MNSEVSSLFESMVADGAISQSVANSPQLATQLKEKIGTALLAERQRCREITDTALAAGKVRLGITLIEAGTPAAEAVIKIGPARPLLTAGTNVEEVDAQSTGNPLLTGVAPYEVGSELFLAK